MAINFDYQNLKIEFNFQHKSISVELTRKFINNQLVSELNDFLSWLAPRKEVRSVIFSSSFTKFSEGVCPEFLASAEAEDLQILSEKTFKFSSSLLYLPQTIIVDFQMGADNYAIELMSGADIKISHQKANFNFNHTKLGLTPSSSSISIMRSDLGASFIHQWSLIGDFSAQKLESAQWLGQTYNQRTYKGLLTSLRSGVFSQAPIQRVQFKFLSKREKLSQIDALRKTEIQMAKASYIAEDWKNKGDFMPIKHLATALRVANEKSKNKIAS